MKQSYPWWSYPLLLSPNSEALDTISKSPRNSVNIPNLWQVGLGVLRMYHRLVFRSETIGTGPLGAVRSTWRSKILRHRMVRGPVLWSQGAIADLSGLSSSVIASCSIFWRLTMTGINSHMIWKYWPSGPMNSSVSKHALRGLSMDVIRVLSGTRTWRSTTVIINIF